MLLRKNLDIKCLFFEAIRAAYINKTKHNYKKNPPWTKKIKKNKILTFHVIIWKSYKNLKLKVYDVIYNKNRNKKTETILKSKKP